MGSGRDEQETMSYIPFVQCLLPSLSKGSVHPTGQAPSTAREGRSLRARPSILSHELGVVLPFPYMVA